MRSIFIRSLLFAVGLILAMEGVHAILLAGLHHKLTGDYGVWNRIVQGRINADILVSGSSRALVDFDSERIAAATGRSCFNIGIDGARLAAQAALLKTYLKHNRPPRVLLQVVDVYSLESLADVYQPSLYVPYLNEPDIFRYVTDVNRSFWAHRYLPLYSFALEKDLMYGALNVFLGREDPSRDLRRNGYCGRDIPWDGSFDRFKLEHPGGLRYNIDTNVVQLLGEMIDTTHRGGTSVVLVYPPEYSENFALTRNREEVMNVFQEVASQQSIPFWDYSSDTICRDKSLFYNSQHLNRNGADIFSAHIAKRLSISP